MKSLKKIAFCKWGKKNIACEQDLLKTLVRSPRYVCTKCGRAARNKPNLCKPDKL